jgi:murein DD-endopeptidase MepM/ murein hydrolase activator NlpD
MDSVGDAGAVDPHPHRDEGDRGDTDSFDPGVETGYLRRAPRDRELSPELGAVPFDPGPGHYDDRRARRAAKRQKRERFRARRASIEAASPLATAIEEPEATVEPETASPEVETLPPIAEPADTAQPTHPADALLEEAAERLAAGPIPLERRETLADRLERERVEREREERERRERIERERAEHETARRERAELKRRQRAEKLQRERKALRRRPRKPEAHKRPLPAKPRSPAPARARIEPSVRGPVKKRARAAENRRRTAAHRRGLLWPTAKAGLAVSVVLGLCLALGAALGLPLPAIGSAGHESLAGASLIGVDAGTPQGLSAGFVFPLEGPHNFGEKEARFGASRFGHVHEGQDIFGKTGTPEVAVHDGVVVDRGKNSDPDDGGRGNYLAIYSPADNHSFVYMHMLKPSPVQLGDQVHAGEVVGQLGCTGSCDGPHLHFEVRIGKATLGADTKAVDPLPYLQQWPQPTPGR